ncbi:hypothetical protein HUU39_07325 [candidate division KSB1 bacterium]|nr:hypothetical protein [bacterium]NUM65075.1 hypothetical protein [candidate division KSB1 bacterium]
MKRTAGKILCLTPTPGKQGTRIDRWKYETLRRAIRRAVPKNRTGVEFRKLAELVRQQLAAEELQTIGSLLWYTTTVKLHLEAIGEIERVPGAQPQRLRRVN